jgi:hypothetical protein
LTEVVLTVFEQGNDADGGGLEEGLGKNARKDKG